MKICITSQGRDLTSPLDPRFGRAAVFVMVDPDTGMVEAVDNSQNLQAAQGAGIQAAQTVARAGVKIVVTGHCGPKAFRVLTAAGIKIFNTQASTVGEALEQYRSGKLSEARAADVGGHWA
ncbi:MAG TPA: NifB/NifX family molybdenum-iron cluster-binding protein [bacterium]|nr:NifB/NifX family molybdenum-iron cluster-binding protein [bacterium]